jgi:hypothetical protein
MLKMLSGLALIGLFFACFLTYIYQNVMFPATLTVAAELALAGSVPGYAGEIGEWMLADGETDYGSPYQASVLTPFDGYEGPAGFYSCGPYFIDTDQVVISSRFHEFRGWDEDCGCNLWHGGIDYATVSPDLYPALLAPISGKVVFAAWSRSGYGNLVVIENAGVRVYLAHLSAMYVVKGRSSPPGTGWARSARPGTHPARTCIWRCASATPKMKVTGWWSTPLRSCCLARPSPATGRRARAAMSGILRGDAEG